MDELQQAFSAVLSFARAMGLEFTWAWVYIQLAIVAATVGISSLLAAIVRRRLGETVWPAGLPHALQRIGQAAIENLHWVMFAIAMAATHAIMVATTWPGRSYLLGVAANLAVAWIVIQLLASQLLHKTALRIVATFAWTVAALSILGVLDRSIAALDAFAIRLGDLRISAFLVLKTGVFLFVTIWLTAGIANHVDRMLQGATDLTPSLRVLIGKLLKLALFGTAVLVVLNYVGIDLSALVIFSGAVGVGVGFGMQKIVSNFISGIILLADKSIKPGDVIAVGESFGWVETMGVRYCSVLTRDGREFLIPNEELVTQSVVNWSHSNDQVRIDVPFGVAYSSDPHRVRALAVDAAKAAARVLKTPEPVCHMTQFGDFSLDFLLRFWIRDPVEGVTNIRGAVLLNLWDSFAREGISIPFPVRDLQSSRPIHVVLERGGQRGPAEGGGFPPAVPT
jgi:small-conductance mechanosensitive channel